MSDILVPDNRILIPQRPGWFGMVSPREEEMPEFLRLFQGWRTPHRKWEDLWRLRRGEFNHVLGRRRFGMPKFQRGSVSVHVNVNPTPGGGDTEPNLQDIQNDVSSVAPTPSRQHYAWDSDGSIEYDDDCTTITTIAYVELTTGTDDANDHTNDWWPDQPETNEGLNWDIGYSGETEGGASGIYHYLKNAGTNRNTGTWYLLDTVSNDHADASVNGSIGINRTNGTAKNPSTGTATLLIDIDIRATGTGGTIATHQLDLQVEGT